MSDQESAATRRAQDDTDWVMTAEDLHIGHSEVVVNGVRYVPESRLVLALALLYKDAPAAVAHVCDGRLDKRGALLGLVRAKAAASVPRARVPEPAKEDG